MEINKLQFLTKSNAYIVYVFSVRYVDNVLKFVRYFYKNPDGNIGIYTIDVDRIAKAILFNKWVVYAGNWNSNNDTLENVCLVVPDYSQENVFLRCVSDDTKINNLENLPRF